MQQHSLDLLNTIYDRVTAIKAFGPDPNEFIGELTLSISACLFTKLIQESILLSSPKQGLYVNHPE
jgi:hypothetical protein